MKEENTADNYFKIDFNKIESLEELKNLLNILFNKLDLKTNLINMKIDY